MSIHDRRLSELEKDLQMKQTYLRSIYDPKTAFGNPKIIAAVREIEELVEIREGEGCEHCLGTGMVEHDCNCDRCGEVEVECGYCNGTGRGIPAKKRGVYEHRQVV